MDITQCAGLVVTDLETKTQRDIWQYTTNLTVRSYYGCMLCVCKFFFFFLVFLGPHLWQMEVPRLGVESEL